MTIFLLVNGLAMVFMVYVSVNFWKEGKRATRGVRSDRLQSLHENNPEVFIARGTMGSKARLSDRSSILQFPAPDWSPQEKQIGGDNGNRAQVIAEKVSSRKSHGS